MSLRKKVEPFLLGGFASCNAEIYTFPIDLVKTRLQIQGQATNSSLRYKGMFDCFLKIRKEEGLRNLFSGIKPALTRQAIYGTLKLGFYQYLKSVFCPPNGSKQNENFYKNILLGSASGASANALANPTDVLKIRLQANPQNFKNKSMIRSFLDIYKNEGLSGLYKGVLPNTQRAAIITGVELSVYDSAKQLLLLHLGLSDSVCTHFLASGMAGFCGAVAATPLDVIKARIMTQTNVKGDTSSVVYKGSIDCLIKTVKNEGPMALYKGFVPSYLRLGPWNMIFFLTYEKFKNHVA